MNIFQKRDDYPDIGDDKTFNEYNSLQHAPVKAESKKLAKDYAPMMKLIRYSENNGNPSTYPDTMSISYPNHPFCQTLVTCKSPGTHQDLK